MFLFKIQIALCFLFPKHILDHKKKLDGLGPVDNRPSTKKLHHLCPENKKEKKMSRVTCHMSHVTCPFFFSFFFFDKVVKYIGGGSVINGAYPVYFCRIAPATPGLLNIIALLMEMFEIYMPQNRNLFHTCYVVRKQIIPTSLELFVINTPTTRTKIAVSNMSGPMKR